MNRLLLIAVFLEVGIVLLVVPWSRFWDRNYFAESLPFVQAVMSNGFVRGAISGLGLLNLFAGLIELVSLLMARRSETPTSVVHRPPEGDR